VTEKIKSLTNFFVTKFSDGIREIFHVFPTNFCFVSSDFYFYKIHLNIFNYFKELNVFKNLMYVVCISFWNITISTMWKTLIKLYEH